MTNFNPLNFIASHAGMNLADAIKEAYEQGKRDAEPNWEKGRWPIFFLSDSDVDERNVGKWIPCGERMPNDNDYRECMECLDGAVWYFTENGAMGLGYYYESTKEWATTDDLRTDGKVIAWMPIPEPYQLKED